jgi:tRNA(Ile)-lysidine synthase
VDAELLSLIAGSALAQARPARLGVAVSGGSDSLALLHLLRDWGGAELLVVTVNHGLRPEAASEALHVERICSELGMPHDILEWRGWDGTGNLQDQARRSRYELISAWARGAGLDAVALGHTRDDVAETFLMRLAREAGVGGLAAMAARFERDGMVFHRPLLEASREALRAVLVRRGVVWVEDASNEDAGFERVRARQVLEALGPLGIDAATLARTAHQLREARAALDRVAADWAESKVRSVSGDLVIGKTDFMRLPAELRRRILAAGLQWVASAEYPPRRDALAEILSQIGAGANGTLSGCRILVSDMTIRLTREEAAVAPLATPTTELWDGRWRLDGPHAPDLGIRALGAAVSTCPDWRDTGLPRASLLASPAVWRRDELVAAPLAGLPNGWLATAEARGSFTQFLLRR